MEHARAFEPIQDGWIYIEKINYPMIYQDKATPAEYWAGLQYTKGRDVREDAAAGQRPVRLSCRLCCCASRLRGSLQPLAIRSIV
ncbi:hypothetical protein BEL01nite_60630 [Bradyrhizobium elkanii]|nr:hypothetical protein BEL01nite_60630 [Bradyrhizobium elkanii]